ncbi:MAG: molybdenum cofactor guanylyltransferase [Nannocystaceae bacterium]
MAEPNDPPPRPSPSSDTIAPTTAAIVLAGGLSSRMGAPKAWLPWRGVPLLRHVVDVLAGDADTIIVVGAPGQELPPLPEGVLRVDDPPGDRGGPLIGLLAGLRALRGRGELAYFAACDNVFLDRAHLVCLRAAVLGDPTIEAAIPLDPEDPGDPGARRLAHPLVSAVRPAPALAAAEALFAGGGRRPLALFERLRSRWLAPQELADPRVLRTCNTPEEYAAALAELDVT